MVTHYIPAYTVIKNGRQLAACNVFIEAREHSTEPTCERCHAYLHDYAETMKERDERVQRACNNYVRGQIFDRRAIYAAGEPSNVVPFEKAAER